MKLVAKNTVYLRGAPNTPIKPGKIFEATDADARRFLARDSAVPAAENDRVDVDPLTIARSEARAATEHLGRAQSAAAAAEKRPLTPEELRRGLKKAKAEKEARAAAERAEIRAKAAEEAAAKAAEDATKAAEEAATKAAEDAAKAAAGVDNDDPVG